MSMSKGASGRWMLFRKGFNEMGTEPPHRKRGVGGQVYGDIDVTVGMTEKGLGVAWVQDTEVHEGEHKVTVGMVDTPPEHLLLPDTLLPGGEWFRKLKNKLIKS